MASKSRKPPILEWIASAVGLVLAVGLIAIIARDAFHTGRELPPELSVRALDARTTAGGHLVRFELANGSPTTAAQVEIEGVLANGETSSATIDYVPGRSTRRGGLLFTLDPVGVRLRVTGYQDP